MTKIEKWIKLNKLLELMDNLKVQRINSVTFTHTAIPLFFLDDPIRTWDEISWLLHAVLLSEIANFVLCSKYFGTGQLIRFGI